MVVVVRVVMVHVVEVQGDVVVCMCWWWCMYVVPVGHVEQRCQFHP